MSRAAHNITWCVAQTQPAKEHIAEQHLRDQGYDVYLPRFKKICRHARRVEEKRVPLFPRYIFVGMNLDAAPWRSVNGTRGVSYLLMSRNLTPAQVPTHIIDDLRAREVEDGVVSLDSLINFTRGEPVRILEGVFSNHMATFDALDDKSRVHVLLSFMGRDMNVTLPHYAIEAA